MSRLPQLEAQLVAAASGRRPRSRAPRRVAAGVLAAACVAAAVLAFAPRREAADPAPVATCVPAETLALSHALTALPLPAADPIAHAELPTVAAQLMAQTPYPPGLSDGFDWAGTVANDARGVQMLVEYRAYCLWLRYWVAGDDRPGAAAVIADIPRWPTQRQSDPYEVSFQQGIQTAMRTGDVARIEHEVQLNCKGV